MASRDERMKFCAICSSNVHSIWIAASYGGERTLWPSNQRSSKDLTAGACLVVRGIYASGRRRRHIDGRRTNDEYSAPLTSEI
jgi:hypothetical protein